MPSNTYSEIVKAVADYLRESGSVNSESPKSNKQIVGVLREKILSGILNVDVADGTILSYLSQAANNDPGSCIVSGGPHGGYWFQSSKMQEDNIKLADEQVISAPAGRSVTVQEKDLYPLMQLWLEQKGYKSKDMSSLKSGGRWGNPDIIGADRVELFGSVEIDLASCEVKLSDSNWEQVIFEAISHKRFANRSWFCYRVSGLAQPIPKGMFYYAERYRVGVVQIDLTDYELLDLKEGRKAPLDYFERVVERVPALYDHVPLREQRDLIERTGVSITLTF